MSDVVNDGSLSAAAKAFEAALAPKEPPKETPAPAPQARPVEQASAPEAAPPEDPDNTNSDDADEPPPDNSEAVDPPSSMSDELKAEFAKLPPEMQRFLVQRERDVAKGGEKITGKAKQAETQAAKREAEYQQNLQRLMEQSRLYRHPDIVAFEREWKDVNEGKVDPAQLLQTDLGKYLEYTAARDKAAKAWNEEQQTAAHAQRAVAEQTQKFRTEENDKLRSALKLSDDKAWAEFDRKITSFVVEHAVKRGYDQERVIDGLVRAPSWALELVADAMKYRDSVAKLQAAQANTTLPKVQKPGVSQGRAKPNGASEDMNRLRKSGRVEDAARLFQRALSQ